VTFKIAMVSKIGVLRSFGNYQLEIKNKTINKKTKTKQNWVSPIYLIIDSYKS